MGKRQVQKHNIHTHGEDKRKDGDEGSLARSEHGDWGLASYVKHKGGDGKMVSHKAEGTL